MGGPYEAGSVVRATGSFININGVPADPTVVQLKYRRTSDTTTTVVTYPAAPIVKDAVGEYHADFDTTNFGDQDWIYQFQSPSGDPVQAVGSGQFHVNKASL